MDQTTRRAVHVAVTTFKAYATLVRVYARFVRVFSCRGDTAKHAVSFFTNGVGGDVGHSCSSRWNL